MIAHINSIPINTYMSKAIKHEKINIFTFNLLTKVHIQLVSSILTTSSLIS